jgi:mRNA interferase YafQ
MKTVTRTTRFDKDVKKMKKRGKSFHVFKQVIEALVNDEILEPKFKDHKLVGKYVNTRECHIEPDWLLVYINNSDELLLVRTGSHTDLFG